MMTHCNGRNENDLLHGRIPVDLQHATVHELGIPLKEIELGQRHARGIWSRLLELPHLRLKKRSFQAP